MTAGYLAEIVGNACSSSRITGSTSSTIEPAGRCSGFGAYPLRHGDARMGRRSCGWTPERYGEFVGEALIDALLGHHTGNGTDHHEPEPTPPGRKPRRAST